MGASLNLSSPLRQKQKTVWALVSKGQPVVAIADRLKTTRKFVNQTKLAAEAKLSTTPLDVAQANHIHITKLSPKEGVLLGYHPGLKRKAIITYSTKHDIKVWYWYDKPEEVTDQEFLTQTRTYLLDIAGERGVEVKDANPINPARLAHLLFSELIPDFRP